MLSIQTELSNDAAVLQARGEVDLSNAQELERALGEPKATHVVLDLSGVGYIDSAGIRAVFAGAQRVEAREQSLLVVAPSGSPASMVLRVAGLAEGELYEDLEAALASIREAG